MTTITLTLSDQTMEQAQQAAAALKRPVEEILSELLAAALPTVHDAPADMQTELTRMTWLDSQELWRIAPGIRPDDPFKSACLCFAQSAWGRTTPQSGLAYPMESISRAIRDHIASAAHSRCEYCQTAQEISGAQMHIEHIIPLAQGGSSDASNLCMACAWCNSYKWAHTRGFDMETQTEVPLFHPRLQQWLEHFR